MQLWGHLRLKVNTCNCYAIVGPLKVKVNVDHIFRGYNSTILLFASLLSGVNSQRTNLFTVHGKISVDFTVK